MKGALCMKETILLQGTLELLFSLFAVVLLAYWGKNALKSTPKSAYIFFGALAILSTVLGGLVLAGVIKVSYAAVWVRSVRSILSGYLPASFFILVMYAGALPSQHFFAKRIMPIRSQLSSIGTLLYLPHLLLYVLMYVPRTTVNLFSGEINIPAQLMTLTGLVCSVLLIILGYTSLPRVRSKMTFLKWKALHRWAYVFYASCFLHYLTLSVWGGAFERTAVYLIIYGSYVYLRVSKHLVKSKRLALVH